MTAEITNENKARFFAQYWGQYVLYTPHLIYTGNPPEPSHEEWGETILDEKIIARVVKHNLPLFLTPLSAITDEDAVEVAKMATHLHEKNTWSVVKIENGKVYFKDSWQVGEFAYSDFFVRVNSFPVSGYFQEKNGEILHQGHYQFPLDAYDFLRSRGYALPWMGLSVDELVQAGWVKLKE